MRPIIRAVLPTLIVFIASIAATGCATQSQTPAETPIQHAQRIEPMLSAAGFHVLPVDTPARQTQLNSLTPLKIRFFPHNGKMHYWYADPYYCNCIYSGNEKAYDAYQRIKAQQQTANQPDLTTPTNDEAASQEYMNAMAWPPNEVFYGGE
jgi:hypothetical protein